MKYLFLILYLAPIIAFSQAASVKEIKLRPDPKFYNTKDSTIIFPVIVTNNKAAGKLINAKMRDEILGLNDENLSPGMQLSGLAAEGLTDLSYTITYNIKGLLSLTVDKTETAGHLINSHIYLTFDIKTGKYLTAGELFKNNMIAGFRKKVSEDKTAFLKAYKSGYAVDLLEDKEIDSSTYEWIIEQVDNNYIGTLQFNDFSLTESGIEIIDPCWFVLVLRAFEPSYTLKYSFQFLHPFLKPEFQKRLPE